MIDFFSSVNLDSVYLKDMAFNINDDINAENGTVAINHEIILMNPKDTEQKDIAFVKLQVFIEVDGIGAEKESFFTLKNTYEAFFNVTDNNAYFSCDIKERTHFCFLLTYPYIVEDIQHVFKRAGIEGIDLALSASPEDMISGEL
ncbi:hypothetical protein JGK46_001228 [Aeromonas bestiarum]|nr:hypothetical protein [Aeromonas bestiarum]